MSFGPVDGLISNLSTTDIVSKIMAAERLRVTGMETRKKDNKTRSDALRDITTRLTSLQNSIATLNLRSTFAGRAVSVNTPPGTNPTLTASANSDATPGSFTVEVSRLATASKATSTAPAGAAVNGGALLNATNSIIGVTAGHFAINGQQFTVDVTTQSLNDVVSAINAQSGTTGVTAALVADADGRAGNRLQLTSAGTINLGSAADTSNFLSAMKVLGVPQSGTTITGQGAIGGVKTGNLLNAANTSIALAGSGSFTINGEAITWNAGVDTLNDVIGRINSSAAGVSASFDPNTDRLVLVNNSTGNLNISLADTSGNLLTAFNLVGGGSPVTLGQTAEYKINGGATQYSASNTISNALPGVTLNLLNTNASPLTVTVGTNPDAAVTAVKAFVNAFNGAVELIEQKTASKNTLGKAEVLASDPSIRGIADTLRSLASTRGLGLSGPYQALQDVGITTGAVGSEPGSTKRLSVDETKLRAALAGNSNAVFDLFSATSQVALTTPGDVSKVSGAPLRKVSGTYAITSNGAGLLAGTFTPTAGAPEALTGSGVITIGGSNTSLVPGLTLTGAGSFSGAATTITVTARSGVVAGLNDYLKGLTGSGGLFESRQTSIDTQQRDLDARISRTQERLDAKERTLFAQFQRLEVSLARLQSQSSSLSASLSSLQRSA